MLVDEPFNMIPVAPNTSERIQGWDASSSARPVSSALNQDGRRAYQYLRDDRLRGRVRPARRFRRTVVAQPPGRAAAAEHRYQSEGGRDPHRGGRDLAVAIRHPAVGRRTA